MDGNQIPEWAKNYLNDKQVAEIQDKIAQIEKLTSAELVPMVVKTAVDEKAIHRFLFVLIVALFAVLFQSFVSLFWLTSTEQLFIVLVGFGLIWLSYKRLLGLPLLKRWLLSKSFIQGEVYKRAQLEFYQTKMQDTQSRTGILFLISLEDRAAAVYADPKIAEILKQEVWRECILDLIQGAKGRLLSQGFNSALERVSQLLAKDLPASLVNENEISNQLIIKP